MGPGLGALEGEGHPLAASSHSPGARAAAWEGPPSRGPGGTQALVGALNRRLRRLQRSDPAIEPPLTDNRTSREPPIEPVRSLTMPESNRSNQRLTLDWALPIFFSSWGCSSLALSR